MDLSCFVLSLVFAPHQAPFVFINERNADGKMLKPGPVSFSDTYLADAHDETTANTLKQRIEDLLATERFAKLSWNDGLVDLEDAIREAAKDLNRIVIAKQLTAKELYEIDMAYEEMEDALTPDDEDDYYF